ncbi:DUF2971 domain-containing protein [Pseudomonas sp. FW305-70]|uniref:DUF2971 domain-containing protein n=1 Tax=Pseudomonas sp. FW305-70 TaxID=2751342 RepID=UPI000C8883BD|nr:DUF2971 domain-containing protein [Pseudomonas sp. FW305-70]PMZ74886.1 hypothetical protein C1X65_14920 [Pseudomonas sp. FW305-70]
MADSLFHYTDVGAVKSILENREFWLTDIRFLNDSQELNDGVVFILDALSELKKGAESGDSFILQAINELSFAFDSHMSDWIDNQPTFVCSFSESVDQLSQWRAYGSYAIEFDSDLLLGDVELFDCVYDRELKIKIAAEDVSQSVQGLARDFKEFGDEIQEDSLIHLSTLVRTASTFKDKNFYEEHEVRCAIDLSIPSSDLKFRQRGSLLIPYTTVKFAFECIKAIHIGPMRDQDLAYTAMKAFVSNIEHEGLKQGWGNSRQIKVVKSNIPYRAP